VAQANVKTFGKSVYNRKVAPHHKPMTSREQFFLQKMMHIVACQDIIDGQLYYQEVKKTTTSSSLKSKYLKKE
jgi:hypothetical protein